MAEVSAKQFAGIADSLLQLEQDLKSELLAQEQLLSDQSLETRHKIEIQDKIFSLNSEFTRLVSHFEKNYPKYYELKYNAKVVSASALQQVLDKQTAILSYTLRADSTLCVTIIKKKSIDFHFVPLK